MKKTNMFRLGSIVAIYLSISWAIQQKVLSTSDEVIDEKFHLPQGLLYCKLKFDHYDPKITTLPGLYLLSTIFCTQICTVPCLRFVNIIASTVNIILFYLLRKELKPKEQTSKIILDSLSIALLPPLYFFSHLYYTDVASIATIVATAVFALKGRYIFAVLMGTCSILMRQTNIIFVFMFAAFRLSGCVFQSVFKKGGASQTNISEKEMRTFLKHFWNGKIKFEKFFQMDQQVYLEIVTYLIQFASFALFILWNGGIVVGDKQAHTASLHIPQMFYFAVFTLIFGAPHLFNYVKEYVRDVCKHYLIFTTSYCIIALIVQYNTLIHPYLLADNRHYTFYVWNRFMNSELLRQICVPLYHFGIYVLCKVCYDKRDVRFACIFLPSTFLVLCFQRLLEIRYFLPPFVLMRLITTTKSMNTILECLFYVLINVITFYIFFTKEIFWEDMEGVQRLIW